MGRRRVHATCTAVQSSTRVRRATGVDGLETTSPRRRPGMILHIVIAGRLRKLTLERTSQDGSFTCVIDGEIVKGSACLLAPGILSLLIGSDSYRCVLEHGDEESAVHINGQRYGYRVEDPRSLKARRSHLQGAQGPRSIKAPMPGRVVQVLVAEGDEVEAQQG